MAQAAELRPPRCAAAANRQPGVRTHAANILPTTCTAAVCARVASTITVYGPCLYIFGLCQCYTIVRRA